MKGQRTHVKGRNVRKSIKLRIGNIVIGGSELIDLLFAGGTLTK